MCIKESEDGESEDEKYFMKIKVYENDNKLLGITSDTISVSEIRKLCEEANKDREFLQSYCKFVSIKIS